MLSRLIIFLLVILSAQFFSQVRDSIEVDAKVFISDSMAVDTSIAVIDSSKYEVIEKNKIIFQMPFSDQSYFITKNDILKSDYRYTGDLLKQFPFTFERSYGFIGQPNNIYLYGQGSRETSYFIDGLPITSTLYYSLDFNHIQSEDIDCIEIVPLPRGFLYGVYSRPVSANFISKDIIPAEPYSRIKYYEGPFGEAFIDGIFSMKVFKDLIASVDITNRKVDDSYKNSAFSIWQAKAKLRYNLSEKINFIGSYYFSKSSTGINGGVNVDKIKQETTDIDYELYNETLAPVYYENNSLDFKQHNFRLKVLSELSENYTASLDMYYTFAQNDYNKTYFDGRTHTKNTRKAWGAILNQKMILVPFKVELLSGYQYSLDVYSSITPNSWSYENAGINRLFISSIVSIALFDSFVVPTFFCQTKLYRSNENGVNSYNNFYVGGDLSIYLNETNKFYLGFSDWGIDYKGNRRYVFEGNIFFKYPWGKLNVGVFNKNLFSINQWGLGLSTSFSVWNLLIEGRASQYFVEKGSNLDIPKTNLNTGIYYTNHLFNSNLDLKTGFVVSYMGKQSIEFLFTPNWGSTSGIVNSWFTIDFTLTADIKKAAIVYFTWENLLDKKYYITPYYPMLQRNIRFGVAWEIFN